jgi:PAS domain S-box-containing protein
MQLPGATAVRKPLNRLEIQLIHNRCQMSQVEGFLRLERELSRFDQEPPPCAANCLEWLDGDAQERQGMLETAQRLAKLGSWLLYPRTGVLLWSQQAHEILGVSQSDLQHLHLPQFLERVHPEDRGHLADLVEELYSRKLSMAFGYRFLGVDGLLRQLRVEGESQVDSQGRVVRVVGTVMDITAQNQLFKDADRLRELEQAPTVWLWEQDASFRFTQFTGQLRDARQADCLGKTCWEVGTPLNGTWDDHLRDLEARRPLRDFELRIGSQVVSVTGAPVFAPDGRFRGYRGTALDVTALKTFEAQAQQAHGLLRMAARMSRVGAWSLDVPEGSLTWSAELQEICGSRPRTLAEALSSVFEPSRQRLEQAIAECSASGMSFQLEIPSLTASGQFIWLRVAGEALRVPSGEIRRVQGTAQDISEAHSARQALEESEERYRLLFETSADAILKRREDGTILRANPAACAMFGMSREQLLATNAHDLVAPDDARIWGLVDQRRSTGTTRGELTLMRADGSSFQAEVHSANFQTADGSHRINNVIRDVTERTRLRRQLELSNEQLTDLVAERTAELETANAELKGFAHSLAHDLKQPIAGARALSTALRAAIAKRELSKADSLAEQVTAAAELMDEYVNALLSLAKISQSALEVEEVDLSAIAHGLASELARHEPLRTVQFDIQPGLLACGDAMLLRLLLQNLLGNAVKFTSRCAVAQISLTSYADAEGRTVYCVRDNGAGFDPGQAHRLFGNFTRLHRQSDFPGTGIGLANAKCIVERHGGAIWAHSQVGEGAAFMFTLERPSIGGTVPRAAERP